MRQGVPADHRGPPPTAGNRATRSDGARPHWRDATERLLADTLLRAAQSTTAYGGVIYLRSPDRRSLVMTTVVGVPLNLLTAFHRIPVAAPLPIAEAFRTGRTIILADAEETMRRFPRLAVGLPYVYASACTPITTGDRTLGVLAVLWPVTATGPAPSARRQLRSAANRIAAALAPYGEEVAAEGEPTAVQVPAPAALGTRVGLFDWDLGTGRLTVDDELCEILGIPDGDFDGRGATLLDRLAPEDVPLLRDAARSAARDGTPLASRMRVRDAHGGYRTVEIHGRATAGSAHLVVAVLDGAEGAAAVTTVERLRDGVFSLDPEGRVSYVNHSAELLLRVRRDELLGRHPWNVLPWLADPAYEDRYRAAMFSQQPTAFLACRPPDYWLAFSLYPDAHGVTGRIVPSVAIGGRHEGLPEAPPPTRASLGATYHLMQLASALTEAVTAREVCERVIDEILPGFGGQELAIYLAHAGRMHLLAQSGYPAGFLDPFEGVSVRARLPGTEVFSTGAPAFFESGRELLSAYPGIPRDEMNAWAFLPLIASGHPVGTCILGFDQPRAFSTDDRAVLTATGGLIAQALERARLYDAEFALARGLQQALLPHRIPTVPGLSIAARYLPGTLGMEIGGDWYDIIAGSHGLYLVIGDVEGHNVGAAATMGQLRSAVRAFTAGGTRPDEVLYRTNELLLDLDPGLLASCCLLHLDLDGGGAHAVRAGHVPPLLRRPDGSTEVLDLGGGPLLGVERGVHYPVTELSLPTGAVLALYTDGLVEDPGAPIEQGIDRLRSSLAHAAPGGLEALADRLLGDARRSDQRADDVALLLTARI